MSNRHLDAIFADKKLKGSERLVMLVLANRANNEDICWPSRVRIADEAGISVRQVERIIPKLITGGYIERLECGNGRGNKAQYLLLVKGDTVSVLVEEKGDICDTQRATSATIKGDICAERATFDALKGDIASHTREEPNEPSLEPEEQPEGREPARDRQSSGHGLPVAVNPPSPTPPRNGTTPRMVKGISDSPHLKGARVVNGYILPGTGANAVQVYHERFGVFDDAAQLSAPKEDDLVHLCTDLDRLREVVTAYSRTNYKPGNVQLILDWYRNGIPTHRNASASAQGPEPRTKAGRSLAAVDRVWSAMKPTLQVAPEWESIEGDRKWITAA